LSIVEDFPFEEKTIPLVPGDLMVVFSDGITEAINPNQELFGEGRLADLLQHHRGESAAEIIESIIRGVKQHSAAAPQMDDMTILVVKRLSH